VAYDVRNPWPDGKSVDLRHYEICAKHADEFWPDGVPDCGCYVERDQAQRIRDRLVPR
jgi:hypothetical protein